MTERENRTYWQTLLSFLPGVQSLMVALAFFLLLGQQISKFANDPGVGWHLADGAQISASGAIPHIDTFLSEQRPWISDQWLSDLALYRVFEFGGWPLLYAVLCVVYMSTFFGVVYPSLRSITKGTLAASVATFFAYKMALIHFILRPVLLSFALFAPLSMLVFGPLRTKLRSGEPLGLRIWIGVPLLFLLWAQIHPSFILGLLLLGIVVAGAFIDRLLCGRAAQSRVGAQGFLLLSIAAAVTLINPYGVELHRSIMFLGRSDFFMHLNIEWLPIRFLSFEGFVFFILVAGVSCAAAVGRKYLSWATFEYVAVVTFAIMAARAARMLPYFAIVSVVPIAEVLGWLATTRWAREGYVVRLMWPVLDRVSKRESSCGRGLVVLGALSVAVLADSLLNGRLLTFSGPFGPTQDAYPYAAIREILKDSQTLERKPTVITIPNWGGFTVWEGRGRLLPQIDDRNTMLGEGAYHSLLAGLKDDQALLSYARAMHGDYILIPAEPELKLDQACKRIYADAVAVACRIS